MRGLRKLVVVAGVLLAGQAWAITGTASETDFQGGVVGIVNPLAVAVGGTSVATWTDRAVAIGRGTAAIEFAAPGAAGTVLRSTGAASNPAFGAVDLADTDAITNTLPPGNGGTGQTAATDDSILVANGTVFALDALADCDGPNQAVTYDTTANNFGCVTITAGASFLSASTLGDACTTATANCGASGNTVYMGPGTVDQTEGRAQAIAPIAMTIDDLRCVSSAAPGSGETWTVTMRDGACTGALTGSGGQVCVISGTARSCTAAATEEAVTAGECFSFEVVGSDGAANGVVTCLARQSA